MSAPLLSVRDLSVTFRVRPRGSPPWTRAQALQAVRGVSFDLARAETLGIVGESGSGKSTLARALIGTVPATEGQALWQGKDLLAMDAEARRPLRRDIQMIFQNPLGALDPRMTAGETIAEALTTHERRMPRNAVHSRVAAMLERVGLLPEHINRYPHEFSGGQCQRINVARALIVEPKLVICDEPVSALDVSVQAQIVNLLQDLKRDLRLALIFISHDLSVVEAHLRPHHGVLSRPHDGVRRGQRPRSRPPPSLHPRPDRDRAGARPRDRARARGDGAEGRAAFAARAAVGLRVPHPLPHRPPGLRERAAGHASDRPRSRGGVSLWGAIKDTGRFGIGRPSTYSPGGFHVGASR